MLLHALWLACVGTVDSRALPSDPVEAPRVAGHRIARSADDVGPFQNRLVDSASPYLRQHGHNPVDWYPWGEEAFAEARRRQVPIFLSIGYAACHWCHVMEEESFEDVATAAYLNTHYVAIKVDRESRPDIDAFYLDALHAMGDNGGWPASLWLGPDGLPFYGGTYFPKVGRYGRPGFLEILQQMSDAWQSDPAAIGRTLEEVDRVLTSRAAPTGRYAGDPQETLALAVSQVQLGWDARHGGWGSKKFPRAPRLAFMLEQGVETSDPELLDKVETLLRAMDRGGLHDHLGGGFHRYTVDATWTVPHFEKMLYDNAQLLRLYALGAVVFEEPRFAEVARGIAGWMDRELLDPEGGYWSSLDADSDGEEGTFYVWTPSQIREVLGEDAERFQTAYGVTEAGNFEGTNVLVRVQGEPEAFAEARLRLLHARSERVRPATDDKLVVSYNGLALGALAVAGRYLDDAAMVARAEQTAQRVLEARVDGVLPRVIGPGSPPGLLDDHAFVANGLLDLYEASGDLRWLQAADEVAAVLVSRFGDEVDGGFYRSPPDTVELPLRRKDVADGAEPSGQGVAVRVLQRLEAYGASSADPGRVEGTFVAAGADLERGPGQTPTLATALLRAATPSREVILVVGSGRLEELAPWAAALSATWVPALHVASLVEADEDPPFASLAGKQAGPDGAPRAYVCTDRTCKQPADDLPTFLAQLHPEVASP